MKQNHINIKTKPNIGRRIISGFIDYLIIYISTLVIIFAIGEQNSDGEYVMNGITAIIPILFWFLTTVGCEVGLGSTIGNSLVGLKAIPLSGADRRLSFSESFKRHLLDPIDMFFFGIVGIITINSTGYNQRVGDLWAKTIVIKKG